MPARFVDMSQATSQGALSEYIRIRADHVAKKPKNIGAVEAAGIATTALTAWQMLFRHAQIKEGDHIFVNGGTTSVGMWAIQIAKANRCRVTATTSGKNYQWLKETFHVDAVCPIAPLIVCMYSQPKRDNRLLITLKSIPSLKPSPRILLSLSSMRLSTASEQITASIQTHQPTSCLKAW